MRTKFAKVLCVFSEYIFLFILKGDVIHEYVTIHGSHAITGTRLGYEPYQLRSEWRGW